MGFQICIYGKCHSYPFPLRTEEKKKNFTAGIFLEL
jgi:hypothetical protein